jgi:hypothetical protein
MRFWQLQRSEPFLRTANCRNINIATISTDRLSLRLAVRRGCIITHKIMKVTFQLDGSGERPGDVELPLLPRKGDGVEYKGTIYSVVGIRFLLGGDSPKALVLLEPDEHGK